MAFKEMVSKLAKATSEISVWWSPNSLRKRFSAAAATQESGAIGSRGSGEVCHCYGRDAQQQGRGWSGLHRARERHAWVCPLPLGGQGGWLVAVVDVLLNLLMVPKGRGLSPGNARATDGLDQGLCFIQSTPVGRTGSNFTRS